MYIKELVVENIKSFDQRTAFSFSPGLNFIVGDNNCGKSTLFEAIMFLSGSKYDPDALFTTGAATPSRVELTLAGSNLESRLSVDRFSKVREYLHPDERNELVLKVERSTEIRKVQQGGRSPVTLDVKKICFWSNERSQFENPTGIDALFRSMVDFETIWADTIPGDTADFGATKTLGRLLSNATSPFYETPLWESFKSAHNRAFSDDDGSLSQLSQTVADEIAQVVQDQYGQARVRFDFPLPDAAAFVKAGSLHVHDGTSETPLDGKGTGMQRAFALAIVQLWAQYSAREDEDDKPLILLIDEPETWLHPVAQRRLASALAKIAETQQLFVVTHSPYLLQEFQPRVHQLIVFRDKHSNQNVTHSNDLGIINGQAPSLGEITYRAFGICTIEFHNELYGAITKHLSTDTRDAREKEIDDFLAQAGIEKSRDWERTNGQRYRSTLPVFIRNSIHHPENQVNDSFTEDDLRRSIQDLLPIVAGLENPNEAETENG